MNAIVDCGQHDANNATAAAATDAVFDDRMVIVTSYSHLLL
jgi:hypothetical protein